MALTYDPVEFTGRHFEEVWMEALFLNDTIGGSKVQLIQDIKNETILTEFSATPTISAFECGVPTAAGDIVITDAILRPIKHQAYDEWCPDDLRFTRFAQGMKKGAWEVASSEFDAFLTEEVMIRVSRAAEQRFWNSASQATKDAVALLVPGAAQTSVSQEEQDYVAAAPLSISTQDGIVTKLIYNYDLVRAGAVGTRIKVVGTEITRTNIWDEYTALYEAVPMVLLQSYHIADLRFFAPESHIRLIQLYNKDQDFRDRFDVNEAGTEYRYLGIKIEFVPLPENCMIAGKWHELLWGTDVINDWNMVKIDRIANNREDWFYKVLFTMDTAVRNQHQKVLYLGSASGS